NGLYLVRSRPGINRAAGLGASHCSIRASREPMTGFVIPAVWGMIAGAWLATGAIHLAAALKPPRPRARLAFCALAGCAATVALFQLALLNTGNTAHAETLLRWVHVPMFAMMLVLLMFTRAYFD